MSGLEDKLSKFKKNIRILWENPKATYTAIIILLIFAVIFGWWRITDVIKSPFVREQLVENVVQDSIITEMQDINSLRNKDTDGDGLSDYDESYVYGTSPYLEDTDSDGYSDKIEIATGNDPNCLAGQKCLASAGEVSNQASADAGANPFNGGNPLNVSDEELRQLLLDSGADPAVLSQVDDASLRQMYNKVIAEIQLEQAGNGDISAGNVSQPATLEQLQNLSASDVRQLLLQSGASEEDVNAVSDAELMSFYQEILDQQAAQ